MRSVEITVHTGSRRGLFDITGECERFVAGSGDGLLTVFVPHATAGIVIMELGVRARTRICSPPWSDCWPMTTSGAIDMGRPATARTMSCRC
jgi:hypothetical protein